jgi:hypothetical protein
LVVGEAVQCQVSLQHSHTHFTSTPFSSSNCEWACFNNIHWNLWNKDIPGTSQKCPHFRCILISGCELRTQNFFIQEISLGPKDLSYN